MKTIRIKSRFLTTVVEVMDAMFYLLTGQHYPIRYYKP